MSITSPRIGVACLHPSERAAIADWMRAADLEPVILLEACLVSANAAGAGLECVIADAELVKREFLHELRRTNPHLPIIALGNSGDPRQAELERREVRFLARPLDQRSLLLAVSLAMAEGRPTRRSLRRLVPRLPSKIDGISAILLDVSGEGLRVEVATDQGVHLAPLFHVQVPMFKVGVTVRRIWVAGSPGQGKVQCGASLLESDERAIRTWRTLIENVGSPAAAPRVRPQPAKVHHERFLGRLGHYLAEAPVLGSALSWRPGRPS